MEETLVSEKLSFDKDIQGKDSNNTLLNSKSLLTKHTDSTRKGKLENFHKQEVLLFLVLSEFHLPFA